MASTPVTSRTRFGAEVLTLRDPDGMALELVVDDTARRRATGLAVPCRRSTRLRGFFGVTFFELWAAPTGQLLTGQMGYRLIDQEGDRWRYRADSSAIGGIVDVLERPGIGFGRMGAGSVHHVAFRARDDAEELAYQTAISSGRLRRDAGARPPILPLDLLARTGWGAIRDCD